MELLTLSTDFWALFWTTLVTVVFLLVPGVVYAYFVLDEWIDGNSYAPVMASVDRPPHELRAAEGHVDDGERQAGSRSGVKLGARDQ